MNLIPSAYVYDFLNQRLSIHARIIRLCYPVSNQFLQLEHMNKSLFGSASVHYPLWIGQTLYELINSFLMLSYRPETNLCVGVCVHCSFLIPDFSSYGRSMELSECMLKCSWCGIQIFRLMVGLRMLFLHLCLRQETL